MPLTSTFGSSSARGLGGLRTFKNPPAALDYLVVAGGGGGGAAGSAGGGGAGGARTGSMNVSVGQSLTATVGAGGSSGGSYGFGSNGGSSQLGSINATYGGGGAAGYGNYNGYAGGSGGGGGNATGNGPPGYGGSGNLGGYSPSEGNSGGNASSDNNTYRNGGAGGGLNLVSSIRGTGNVTYAYGGCQGGNCCACAGINGVNHRPANSGGGGHASSGVYNQFYGTNGGSGIVVISYPDSFDDLTSLTGVTYSKTLANGKKIYSITAGTGTVTV